MFEINWMKKTQVDFMNKFALTLQN